MPDSPGKAVFPWLCQALAASPTVWEGNAETIFESARYHGILPLLYTRLQAVPEVWAGLSASLRQELRQAYYQAVALEMSREPEIQAVLAHLQEADISVLLLKGTPLAYSLYPAPYLRSRCDVDLLFREHREAERAWKVLRSQGYQRAYRLGGDQIFRQFSLYRKLPGGQEMTLDLHWHINNHPILAQALPPAELFDHSQPLPALGPFARTLHWRYSLLLSCVHLLAHAPEGTGDRLIWYYDIHLLAQRLTAADWEALYPLAVRKGLTQALLAGLTASHKYFRTQIPPEILEKCKHRGKRERFTPSTQRSPFRAEFSAFWALPHWKARRQFLREHLFPPPAYMRVRYGDRKGWALPWLYLYRIGQGIRRLLRL